MHIPKNIILKVLYDDVGLCDLTSFSLDLERYSGKVSFYPKSACVICGVEEIKVIADELNLECEIYKKSGDRVEAGEQLATFKGDGASLHQGWKMSQVLLESMSAVATMTANMLKIAKGQNPNIDLLTTRKNIPSAKELQLKAIMSGGAMPHRMGLYDSVLIFAEHTVFLDGGIEEAITLAKAKNPEKKIAIEVDTPELAHRAASAGADILQCEKFTPEALNNLNFEIKSIYPDIKLSATGGVNLKNIAEYAGTGVDMVVTSAPYYVKPLEIKCEFERV
ncbi:MAG: ModD protein [Campylobacterales bacterium]